MCGYLGNVIDSPGVIELMDELGIQLPLPYFQSYQRRIHPALITEEAGVFNVSKAMWWYAMTKGDDGRWTPNTDVTSFNARNVDGRMWKPAIERRRGIILGTEVGESKGRDRFLMSTKEGLAVGAVYQDWRNPEGGSIRSMAVITRPPHPRFSKYHDKSIPMFLPLDPVVIKVWLDQQVGTDDPRIRRLLDEPKIYTPLAVTKVKSFLGAEAVAEPEELAADM